MEDTLRRAFAPHALVLASDECRDQVVQLIKVPQAQEGGLVLTTLSEEEASAGPNAEADAVVLHARARNAPQREFLEDVVVDVVRETMRCAMRTSPSFESFGHPIASILVVGSQHSSPIGALTKLYQQSFTDLPAEYSPYQLRCVWYLESPEGTEEDLFPTVLNEFGPHCYKINPQNFEEVRRTTLERSIVPYMQQLLTEWRNQRHGGLGKLLKRLVSNGPPRPEVNLFQAVQRAMQPHVASIPFPPLKTAVAEGGPRWLDWQYRRLADVAFVLREYELARGAYEQLRKTFQVEQEWASLGAACEMGAVAGALLGAGSDIRAQVDTALYTYHARIKLPLHFLRCILLVAHGLQTTGDQLLAAGLLANALLEVDPVFGGGSHPAEAAMLMEQIAYAYEERHWQRKALLWHKLADSEWART